MHTLVNNSELTILWYVCVCLVRFHYFPYENNHVSIFPTTYTRVFIKPRTVTKLRTLDQLRHRSVARLTRLDNMSKSTQCNQYFTGYDLCAFALRS